MKTTRREMIIAALVPAFLVLGSTGAWGWRAVEEDEAEESQEDEYFVIQGGDVHTGNGAVLRGATILAKNGKIEEIGYDLYIPEDAQVLDVPGMRCYPGLVALSASRNISRGILGLGEESPPEHFDPHFGLDDTGTHVEQHPDEEDFVEERGAHEEDLPAETKSAFQAEGATSSDAGDGFDPFSQYLVLALASGITTAEQSNVALKLKRSEIEGVAMKEKPLVTVTWSRGNPSSIRRVKENFAKASEYLREYHAWETIKEKDKDAKEPSRKGVDTNALRILQGKVLARFNNDGRSELLGIARLAQRYGFHPVIFGCMEGWCVADELGRAGAYAVVTPRTRQAKEEALVRAGGSSIENAAILHRAGVQVAIVPGNTGFELSGITGRDLMHLPVEAGFAVRGGLSEQAALEGISSIPARILGVEHRVGTIEVGKDCDVVVTDGDILHYQTFVQFAVVEGKLVYDKQEELFYAHIRPRPEHDYLRTGAESGEDEPEEAGEQEQDSGEEGEADESEEGDEEKAGD